MNTKQAKKFLETMPPDRGLKILYQLCQADPEVLKRAEQLAMAAISHVDIEAIADDVFSTLDGIDVEELWHRSGSTPEGYVEPHEMAFYLFEEETEPFLTQLKEYQTLLLQHEAKSFCMGLLKGIYLFDQESKSQYREWAEDVAGEVFSSILDEWKEKCKEPAAHKEMDQFMKTHCPKWA